MNLGRNLALDNLSPELAAMECSGIQHCYTEVKGARASFHCLPYNAIAITCLMRHTASKGLRATISILIGQWLMTVSSIFITVPILA